MRDDEAFVAFVTTRGGALFRTAALLTGDRHAGQDLLQTTLTKTFLSWRRIRDPGAAEAFARTTMVRTFVSSRRRRWRNERAVADVPDVTAGDHAGEVAERDRLRRAMALLPPGQRAVLVLRFFDDLSVDQTAVLLDCSQGTVKSQTSRALQSLRDRLTDGERVET